MWRERIIETRKAKGITIKMMSEHTHLTVETVTRILNTKTDDPRIGTVLALGESVGLSPWELFADTNAIVAYQGMLMLQAENDGLKADKERLLSENATLKGKIDTLRDKIDALTDEILSLHTDYRKLTAKDTKQ